MLYRRFVKRALDIALSSVGLVALSPLFLLIALLIKLEDGGKVIFRQTRVGENWKPFEIYKFRTMVENAERMGPQVTKAEDSRVTKVGRFLRRYRLDELPQLLNVLKGEMSIVGPRPEVPRYAELFKRDYDEILKVKPGITDYASLAYKDEGKPLSNRGNPEEAYIKEILPGKIKLYKKYVNEVSFLTDAKLIVRTLIEVLR